MQKAPPLMTEAFRRGLDHQSRLVPTPLSLLSAAACATGNERAERASPHRNNGITASAAPLAGVGLATGALAIRLPALGVQPPLARGAGRSRGRARAPYP